VRLLLQRSIAHLLVNNRTACFTADAPEIERGTLPRPPYSPDLSLTDYHFFKHLGNFLQEKIISNQTEAESAFNEFVGSRISDFWNLLLIGKSMSVVMVFILISEVYYKLTCTPLKYKIENQKLFCNNQGRRTVKICTVR
jgi:hypothetical protein